ncbi:uncharacterized protein DUF3159 [Nocardia tenerifensis]|uniref:Uncharacterized protein DUF3159 n=1 Tax=Nocardia tenerifensis TaxID=228006 RepID=A0A318JPY3_9NOCA|nr:DUF3159 domain-containing protein [Nocardia tenerifensis]PXX54941.1 uncharacterized protein DUF3159 [Nocardia tenerifensis]
MTDEDQHVPPTSSASSAAAEVFAKFKQLDGFKRSADAVGPVLAFLIGYQVAGAHGGVAAAIGTAAALAVTRLIRGDSVRVVSASLIAVVLYSLFVQYSGEGRDFFLLNIIGCGILMVLFGVSLAGRMPATLWICRKTRIEPVGEIAPDRLRLHRRITAVWLVNWVLHLMVLAPLYALNLVAALGIAAMLLGKPSVVVLVAVTWWQVQRSRPTHRDDAEPAAAD